MDAFLAFASETYAVGYFGIMAALAVLEWVVPRRDAGDSLRTRWTGNIGVAVLDGLLLRLLFPAAGVVWAATSSDRGWGLLNQVAVPTWLGVVASVAALDFVAYAQHYLLHRVPFLWRIHLTHHTDQDLDFTTGLRFHPIEAVFTTSVTLAVIALLGLPPLGVLVAHLVIVVMSFWEHANVRVPWRLDRALRVVIVTPELHRTHHSQDGRDNRTNFGSVSTCWDRLFGTYCDRPVAGSEGMVPGVRGYEDRKHSTIPWMLAQPFVSVGEPDQDMMTGITATPPGASPAAK